MILDKRLIGIPFLNKGRTLRAADCYGVLGLYYKLQMNIDIPEIIIDINDSKKIMETYLQEISKNWVKIDKPEPNCAVAMSTNERYIKRITHFGVMIDETRMLHTFKKINSHVIRIDSPLISTQIRGFYRWQD